MIITRTEIDALRVKFDGLRALITVFNGKPNLDRKDSITRILNNGITVLIN